jgi:hypothetical protein
MASREIQQKTEKWYKTKAKFFGANDVASLVGHGYQNYDEVINDKVNCIDSRTKEHSLELQKLLDRGQRYESVVADIFAKRKNIEIIETGLKFLRGVKWQTASPDGMFYMDNIPYLLEIKVKKHLSDNIPYKHWIQMQTQMAVWEIEQCIYCQNVIEEFDDYETYDSETKKFPGEDHGILNIDDHTYYWRLNEYSDSIVKFDKVFWDTTFSSVLKPAWEHISKLKRSKSKRNKYLPKRKVVIKPYMLNNWIREDPIIDWLNYHGDTSKKSQGVDCFQEMIRVKNLEFKNITRNYILNHYPDDFVIDIDDLKLDTELPQKSDLDISTISIIKTKKAINDLVPIILNACLSNKSGDRQAFCDMLILNDYIRKIFGNQYDVGESGKYSAIKMKFSTIELRSDEIHLIDNDKQKVYKGQLCFINYILGEIQNYFNPYSYIIGRKYKVVSKGETFNSAFEKIGQINYESVDNGYINIVHQAIDWLEDLPNLTGNLKTLIPKFNLYPNMKNKCDYPWSEYKKQIAINIKEITLMYYCGTSARNYAILSSGVTQWDRLTPKSIKYQPGIVLDHILQFLEINTMKDGIRSYQLDLARHDIEFYIDFESINNMYDDFVSFPVAANYSQIFLIGAVIVDNINNRVHRCSYVSDSLDKSGEKNMIREMFRDFIKLCRRHKQEYIPLYYWGNAEKYMLERALGKKELKQYNLLQVDVCEQIKNSFVIFPGQFNYGLKDIAKAMHKLGLIKTIWNHQDEITNGISAMAEGLRHLKNRQKPLATKYFEDIIHYNYIDCKVVHEIVKCLRKGVKIDFGTLS